jgi:hypothetical protein
VSDVSFSASVGLAGISGAATASLAGGAAPPALGGIANLKVIEMLMPINFVCFDLNPKTFSVKRVQKSSTGGRSTGSGGGGVGGPPAQHRDRYLGAYPREFTWTALLTEELQGAGGALSALGGVAGSFGGVRSRCDILMNWVVGGPASLLSMALGAAASALGIGLNNSNLPPVLILQWGDPLRGHLVKGIMKKVDVKYIRFDDGGNPLRAEVTCVFQEAADFLLSLLTNPTSGGVPGRRGHTLTQGENLQTVAQQNYGRPGAWRELAAANGIDDPLRVRPGRRLSLPPAQEITA